MSKVSARAIIRHNKKIFLVRLKQYPSFWCLPGGRLEDSESITGCLSREILEELGVEPKIGNLLYVHQIKHPDGYSAPSFFFDVKNSNDFININLEQTQFGQAEIAEFGFKDIRTVKLLPSFLVDDYEELARLDDECMPTKVRISQVEA